MLGTFRKPFTGWLMLFIYLAGNIPYSAKAFTGGPGQPETQNFTPHDVKQLVDPFTGDLTYNINLMDVGGYPINLSYRSGVSMTDEASFVGLAWSINPGAINRQVRGLPDDFKADTVGKAYNLRPDATLGITTGANFELFGFDAARIGLGMQMGINKNSYRGYGVDVSLTPSMEIGKQTGNAKLSGSLSVGLSSSSGAYLNPNLGLSFSGQRAGVTSGVGIGAGVQMSSREGLKEISFSGSFSRSLHKNLLTDTRKSASVRANFPVSFATPTFTPTSDIPMFNTSLSLRFKLGVEVYGTMIDVLGSGYFSLQSIRDKRERFPSYGYLYAHEAGDGRVLTDFNREKDGPYQKELPNLGLTNFSYDLYAVSGQGISGQFRPFRNDIGTVSDTYSSNQSTSVNTGGEVALGNLVHAGVDVTVNQSSDHTGAWSSNNGLYNVFTFKDNVEGHPEYEPVYFKSVGEKTAMHNETLFNRIGAFDPMHASIGNGTAENKLVNGRTGSATTITSNQNHKTVREPRNINFSYLTASEASRMGVDSVKDYSGRSEFIDDITGTRTYELVARPQSRIQGIRKPHHLSEIAVTRDDGARYVYGLPVYSVKHKEVSFNVSKHLGTEDALPHSDATGLVTYAPNIDNTPDNTRGLDQYYHAVETPAHANAFLLTSILSDDYVDITGNGPTSDDFGTYTRFNYTKTHTNYRWRTPYQQNQARYQEGYKSDSLDNKGSYVYGEKEVWYLQSVETKNYVAEFTLSDREDGQGVLSENGGRDASQRLKKLDRITLYTQSDRITNGPRATPIKEVYFDYDYSLCNGTPDGTRGKLTLKKVSFSYGGSYKGRLSPYEFTYGSANPNYDPMGVDRWGTYKANDAAFSNSHFPYTKQNSLTNSYASAWHLTRIKLPSGGITNVTYESDDYAYVQDKRSMEMIRIAGVRASSAGSTPLVGSTDDNLYEGTAPNTILFFELKEAINEAHLLREYLDGIQELYFKCKVFTGPMHGFETIEGFIPHVTWNTFGRDYGFFEGSRVDGKYGIGWIKLPVIDIGDHDKLATGSAGAHPISKATWQELRKSLPRAAYDKPEPTSLGRFDDFHALIAEIASLGDEVSRAVHGFNEWMRDRSRAQSIDVTESYIRLNSPDKKKLGGGSRVKQITISDEWGNMVPSVPEIDNFSYGQEYSYTTEESFGDSTRTISAGVASYEPLIGNDENPFILPSRYSVARTLALDLNLYVLEPFGESFFPGANVGYSKVRIKNLTREGVHRTATGFTQHEFYTAKDFPTLVQQTALHAVPSQTPPNPFYNELKATVSQGYSIELNDMHGKPKAEKIFQEINDEYPISGTEYSYRTEAGNPHRLDNRATVFNEQSGVTEEKLVGVEYDFILDAREMTRETWGPGVQVNTDGFLAAFIPIFVPIPYPEMSYSISQFRGITTTKVIQRSGLVDKVIAYDLGSRITTTNLAYDGKTGNVLVTKTQNEFEDDYYTSHIPAHWIYDGMGSAYKNIGIGFTDQTVSSGKFNIAGANTHFFRGDEVMLLRKDRTEPVMGRTGSGSTPVGERLSPYQKGWVLETNSTTVTVIDRLGQPLTNGRYDIKIIRSGRRNMPFTSMGSVITKNNPIASGNINFTQVIDASAAEYQEHWQTYAGFLVPLPESTCNCTTVSGNYGTSLEGASRVVQELLVSGDYKKDSVSLNRSNYNSSGYLNAVLGSIDNMYYGEVNGNVLQGVIRNNQGGTRSDCTLQMTMADPGLSFPDSIVAVTLPRSPFNPETFNCGEVREFNVIATYLDHGRTRTAEVKFTSSCFVLFKCSESVAEFPAMTCDVASGSSVNPFLLGILGNWRPKSTYTYITERTSGRIDRHGAFSSFHSFWQPNQFTMAPAVDRSKWQSTKRNTITDPFGKVLEQKDPLNRYSSSIYGYGFNVPVAIASNARYHQIAFDGFEDYAYQNTVESPFEECPLPAHWKFNASAINIDTKESHTGHHSVRVEGEEDVTRLITPLCDPDARTIPNGNRYPIQNCDLIRKFSPPAGEYILQAWVKEANSPSALVTQYNNSSIEIATTSGGVTTTQILKPKGQIIDGWQPVEGSFVIPAACDQIRVLLKGARTSYFDDIRLQPFSSSMETFVYDPVTLKLMAKLDEHNYATFYEYDKEGALVRTKKETERGILTLQEVRTASRKN